VHNKLLAYLKAGFLWILYYFQRSTPRWDKR